MSIPTKQEIVRHIECCIETKNYQAAQAAWEVYDNNCCDESEVAATRKAVADAVGHFHWLY